MRDNGDARTHIVNLRWINVTKTDSSLIVHIKQNIAPRIDDE